MHPQPGHGSKGRAVGLFAILVLLFTIVAVPAPLQSAQSGPTLRAASFNGSSYVEVANALRLNPARAITIEAWVYRNQDNRCETVVGKNYTTAYWLGFCNGTIRFYTDGIGTNRDGVTPIPATIWTHVAVTYDGSTRRYYVNGVLDREWTNDTSGLGGSSAPLAIGADLSGSPSIADFQFSGLLDEVRLWEVARSGDEIRADLYREVSESGGLVAVYRLNGNDLEARGRFASQVRGPLSYNTNGVLPIELAIPRSNVSMTVNGECGANEYAGAERVGMRYLAMTTEAYVQHSASDLFVCVEGVERADGRQIALAVDRDLSRDVQAQPGDYRFIAGINGSTAAEAGNGAGAFSPFTAGAGTWQAAVQMVSEFTWSAEFRISRALLGQPDDWSTGIGLHLIELGRPGAPSNTWPAGATPVAPFTWAPGRFTNVAGSVPSYNFSGSVRQPDGTPISGASVQLLAANLGGTTLIATTSTSASGDYNFTYSGYSPSAFIVQQIDPRGAYSVSASAGADGSASGPSSLSYPGSRSSRSYSPGSFVDAFGLPAVSSLDRHYLVVYSDPVSESDLAPLLDLKRMQGFQVETITTQRIAATVSGRDLPEKVRNWLRSRWEARRPAPVYALLVGIGNIIPVRDVGWDGDNDHRSPGNANYMPAVLTEWYYADLDSNWDTDNDGFYGEYLYCEPGTNKVPNPANPANRLPCPELNSPLREGPFGTSPGPEDDWQPEIAIGRLLITSPQDVRTSLETSAAAERSGSLDKRNALVGGAFWWLDGRSWNTETGRYDEGVGTYIASPWDGVRPFGNDTAEHLEANLRPILDGSMSRVFRLYDSNAPGDDPSLSPTRFTPDAPLSPENMRAEWTTRGYGLVNVAGHGDASGVSGHGRWANDFNNNRQIENPVRPSDCVNSSCDELISAGNFIDVNFGRPAGVPPVVFANACLTGDIWDLPVPRNSSNWQQTRQAIPGTLLARGNITAWVGAVNWATVNGMDGFQTDFNRAALEGQLLGDAVWGNMPAQIRRGLYDWRQATPQLFGDPAYSYWGNPLDAGAYWPQSGRDWRGSSSSPASGPAAGLVRWLTRSGTPSSPPVVDRRGRVIVGGQGQQTIFAPDGTVTASATGQNVSFAPAIATDAIYMVAGATLLVYQPDMTLRTQMTLGGAATGAPRVGPDGIVWVPTTLGMARVTGAGKVQILGGGPATGPAVLNRQGAALWTTSEGRAMIFAAGRFGGGEALHLNRLGSVSTAPVLGPNNQIYLRRGAFLDAFAPDGTRQWSFDVGAAMSAPPAVSGGGTIYAVADTGRVVSLTENGALRWSRNLGAAAGGTPALDGARLYVAAGSLLYALESASGEVLWSVNLGSAVDARSAPAIGADRTVYVTTTNGRLVAVGEGGWLTAPSDLLVEPGIGSATLRWRDNSTGETGFRIERCLIDGSCTSVGTAGANASSFNVTGLTPGQTYRFRVNALGTGGAGLAAADDLDTSSDYSYSDLVTPSAPAPVALAGLTAATFGSRELELRWNAPAGADQLGGYNVLRATAAGGPYTQVGAVGPTATRYVDSELTPGATYFYKLVAFTDGGTSPEAGPVSATTKPVTLAAPAGFTARVQSASVLLNWRDNATNESGYIVERRAPGVARAEPLALLPASATSYTDTYNLAAGRYEYSVRAISASAESPSALAFVDFALSAQPKVYLPFLRR